MTAQVQPQTAKSPFHDESVKKALKPGFVVRSIVRGWNATMGHEEWQLRSTAKDKRLVVLAETDELFKRFAAADPYILKMVKDESREIYPRLTINVKSTVVPGKYQQDGDLSSELKLTPNEQIELDVRKLFDPLHEIRRSLGIGWAEGNRIMRDEEKKGGEDWPKRAEEALRASVVPKPKAAEVANLLTEQDIVNDHDGGLSDEQPTAIQLKPYLTKSDLTTGDGKETFLVPVDVVFAGDESIGAYLTQKASDFYGTTFKSVRTFYDASPTEEHPHWSDEELPLFWDFVAKAPGGFNQLGIAQSDRIILVHEVIDSLHSTKLTREQAQDAVLFRLKALAKTRINPNKPVQSYTEDKPMPSTTKAEWETFLTQHNLNAETLMPLLSAYSIAHEKGVVTRLSTWSFGLDKALEVANVGIPAETEHEFEPPYEEQGTVPEPPAKTPPVLSLPEAPFSATFKLIDKHGVEVMFSVRAESAESGVPKVDDTIERLIKHGYATNRPAPANSTAQNAAPESSNGVATCVMISVGESYQGGKPQLNFECDAMDKPLRFTKSTADMAKLLKNAKKMDGTPFTESDLTIGRKFPGQWAVKWSKKEKDGKTFHDVEAVSVA